VPEALLVQAVQAEQVVRLVLVALLVQAVQAEQVVRPVPVLQDHVQVSVGEPQPV
jgi:hypothetical protein